MNPADTTLAILDQHLHTTQESSFRDHLGASVIGRKCARSIWYSWRWSVDLKHAARLLRLFQRGHLEEPRFVEYLQSIGATVWTEDPNTKKQFRVSACGGHFGGSCDGVAVDIPGLPPLPALCEMKTHGDKSFQKLKKEGLLKSKPEHVKQTQIYMRLLDLKGCLYMAVNKNDDDLFFYYFERDDKMADELLLKAELIVFTENAPPRISNSPSWFECVYCDYKGVCFGTAMPHVNCRTCAHSTPERDGSWSCRKGRQEILMCPKQGCDDHVFNPTYFPQATVMGLTFDENFVTYQTKRGAIVRNGPHNTPSKQLDLTC